MSSIYKPQWHISVVIVRSYPVLKPYITCIAKYTSHGDPFRIALVKKGPM